jgi:cyclic pyranopterin phosphate synthase
MNGLTDRFSRTIDYMRVSVTDRCNLRCIYCMPPEGFSPMEHRDILRYEEIVRVLRVAAGIGVRKIRITGGEPLVRKNIPYLIQLIRDIDGIKDLSLTTNGTLLEKYAGELAAAGLNRVNVSLDSLKPDRYREITRGGDIDAVFKGIEAARKAGLVPVKINMVPIRGLNDDEITDFAGMTLDSPYQVRFIEFMPFGTRGLWKPERFIPAGEIRSVVETAGRLSPVKLRKSGPARYFKFDSAAGVIGFISPLSNHFCGECNRLRLTADGKLRPCLFSETEIDLKPALRSDGPDKEIERLIRLSIEVKPEGHNIRLQDAYLNRLMDNRRVCGRPISKIGG